MRAHYSATVRSLSALRIRAAFPSTTSSPSPQRPVYKSIDPNHPAIIIFFKFSSFFSAQQIVNAPRHSDPDWKFNTLPIQ